jgi:MYXO-CTERM domain-containing protein
MNFSVQTLCRAALAMTAAVSLSPAWAIVGGIATTGFGAVGNGVQITPNWVLTAHHLGLGVGSSFDNAFGSAGVAAVYSPPGAGFPEHDLKLLRLDTPLSGAPLVTLSSTLYRPTALDFLNPALNLPVTLTTNSTQVPRGYAFGQMRDAVVTYLDDHDDDPATPEVPRTVNWLVTYSDALGEPYVEGGDSGGGLFWGHVTDHGTPLLGIASAQFNNVLGTGTQTFASAYVSVAAYRGWIEATMLGDATDNQMPSWVATPVPEPASWALWLGGAALLLAVRQRRRCA